MEVEVEVKNLRETGESGDPRTRRTLLPVMSSINPDLVVVGWCKLEIMSDPTFVVLLVILICLVELWF